MKTNSLYNIICTNNIIHCITRPRPAGTCTPAREQCHRDECRRARVMRERVGTVGTTMTLRHTVPATGRTGSGERSTQTGRPRRRPSLSRLCARTLRDETPISNPNNCTGIHYYTGCIKSLHLISKNHIYIKNGDKRVK